MTRAAAPAKRKPAEETDRELMEQLVDDSDRYAEELLWIRSKRGQLIPLKLNPVQKELRAIKRRVAAEGRTRRFIILKARRQGITTSEQAESFHQVATQQHQQVVTLSHEKDSTEKIFRIANLFYEKLVDPMKPQRLTSHNKKTLDFFKLNSLFYLGTAGKRSFGRGDTLNKFHWSEVAFSPGDIASQRSLLAGLTEACSEGEGVLESTANGVGGLFHETWKDSQEPGSEWTGIFFAWWRDPTYRVKLTPDEAARVAASLTKEEQQLVLKHGLAPEQIAWRRKKKKQLKELFLQEYPEDPETCFLISGECFFDRMVIQALLATAIAEPIERKLDGQVRIWKRPEPGRRYAAGSDVGEGLARSDFSQTSIVDVETMDQVAVLRGRWKPEDFAGLTAELCAEYNGAHLAVERNNHGHSMLNTLVNVLHYPNLYYHLDYDATTQKHMPTLGFPTNQKTRPIMLNELRVAIEKGQMKVSDKVLLAECRTFAPDRNGVYKAKGGCFDDSVMSWAITLQARKKALEGIVVVPSSAVVIPAGSIRMFGAPPRRIF